MSKYSILGYPLKHTMSPPIHKKLFELAGINDYEYTISEIPPEEFIAKIPELNAMDGYNVTIPYKVEIIKYLDELDESAKRYNAVNCVVRKKGKNIGYNTDCYGFLRALEAVNISLDGNVLLLGCGGAGRMMAIETVLHGGKLTIAARNRDETLAIADDIRKIKSDADVCVTSLTDIQGNYDVMLNSTPVGMFPKTDFSPVSEEIIRKCGFVFDAVYNPDTTLLMSYAKKNGIKTLGGMSMLVWQAVVAHEIWNNSSYSEQDINQLISDTQKHISL